MTTQADETAAGAADPFADNVAGTGSRTFRSGPWQIASSLTPYLLTTFVSVVAARVLGPDGMGRQSFISFVIITAMTLCSAGFPAAVPRYIGEIIGRGRQGVLGSLVLWSWRVEVVTAAAGTGALLAVAASTNATPRAAWIFGAVMVFAGVLHKVPGGILNGAQRWRQNSVVTLVTGVFTAIATIITLLAGGGITGIFVVGAIANITMLVWATILSRRLLRQIRVPRERLGPLGREILRFAALASIPAVFNFLVYQRSEFFFLKHFSSDSQIALYSISFSAYAALLAVPTAIAVMITPAVATLYGAGAQDRIRRGYSRSARLVCLITIPLTAGAFVLGPTLLRLIYGGQYAGTGDLLRVLLIPLVFSPIGSLSSGLLIGCGRIRVPVVSTSISAAVDVGLAALLVPRMDAMGAAIANVSAQLVGAVISTVFAVRLVGGLHLSPRHLGKMLIAAWSAAGCAQLVLLVGDGAGPFLLAIASGVAAFAVLSVLLRVLPGDDAGWLVGAVGNRATARMAWICERLSGERLGATP